MSQACWAIMQLQHQNIAIWTRIISSSYAINYCYSSCSQTCVCGWMHGWLSSCEHTISTKWLQQVPLNLQGVFILNWTLLYTLYLLLVAQNSELTNTCCLLSLCKGYSIGYVYLMLIMSIILLAIFLTRLNISFKYLDSLLEGKEDRSIILILNYYNCAQYKLVAFRDNL